MKIKCIAVDDEPLALDLVCGYISQTPYLKLVGRYTSAVEALESIYLQPVDLIFLDIQMKGLTGIELARVLASGDREAAVIFTTAYDQFALEGYKVDAVDYLLKPFSYEEFLRAASKAQSRIKLKKSSPEEESHQSLFLKVEHQLVRVGYDQIRFIEGYKDYVKVHVENGKTIMSLTSLKRLDEILPSNQFMRIHRSYIISLFKVDSLSKNAVQIDEKYLPVSDSYRSRYEDFFSKWRN